MIIRADLIGSHDVKPVGEALPQVAATDPGTRIQHCFGALLYVEKEGFFPLFEKVKLAQRFDIGIMSSKGMSVTAARQLAESICGRMGIPLLVLHDFDAAGILIRDTLENDTRRFSYKSPPNVIDLGLQYDDIGGLTPGPYSSNISDKRLRQAGLSDEAIS
jgi:DNA topoisomerase VI subunit A